jgi:putative RNA 2'-phosphotransferase
MSKQLERNSKFLSLVLRHDPAAIGLELDGEGWASLEQLVSLANAQGRDLTRDLVLDIVAGSDKQRFAIDGTGTRIRANQGHSISVDLKLEVQVPPARLFHGTASRFLESIQKDGLLRGSRQHVHLSSAKDVATTVGSRHGKPVVLEIRADDMHRDGIAFYLSANGVWLTDAVPVQYIDFGSGS